MSTGNPIEHLRERLRPWLERHARPAWRPIVTPGEGAAASSRFGGRAWLRTGEEWPSCTTCGEPMRFFLQLDLGALPAELEQSFGQGLLQLFYCTNDACSANGWEAFASGKLVRIVDPAEDPGSERASPAAAQGPYPALTISSWRNVPDLPHPAEHESLGLVYQFDFAKQTAHVECPSLGVTVDGLPTSAPEDLATALPGDKLAGWPYWVQGAEYPTCPRCERLMRPIFQIDSDDHLPFMFGDVGTGHITQCPVHRDTVTFAWACS